MLVYHRIPSMKWLGVLLLPPGWDFNPSQLVRVFKGTVSTQYMCKKKPSDTIAALPTFSFSLMGNLLIKCSLFQKQCKVAKLIKQGIRDKFLKKSSLLTCCSCNLVTRMATRKWNVPFLELTSSHHRICNVKPHSSTRAFPVHGKEQNHAKKGNISLPVAVRRSRTSVLKLPISVSQSTLQLLGI